MAGQCSFKHAGGMERIAGMKPNSRPLPLFLVSTIQIFSGFDMPRQKLTIAQAKLTGAYRKNPGRYKPVTVKAGPAIGNPPDHLTEGAKAAWEEIVKASTPGVLQFGDRILIEITACLLDEFRSNPNEFKTGKHSNLIGCFRKLGLTPADRQRVQVDDLTDPDDSFDEFFTRPDRAI